MYLLQTSPDNEAFQALKLLNYQIDMFIGEPK
jgi:hypothetical protein